MGVRIARNLNNAGQTHDQLQAACWRRGCNEYGLYGRLIAMPNDSIIGIARWKQMEAMGVTSGVWDMVLFNNGVNYWFEFKVGKDVLRASQKKFRDILNDKQPRNHKFFIIHEEYEFMNILNNIFNLKLY